MEGLISQIKEQEEINFSLELVEESKELSEKVQIFCEQIINRYSDWSNTTYCTLIQSGNFVEAADFAHTQLLRASTVQEKMKWLSLNNGAKAQIFLDLLEKGQCKRADMYARCQMRWHSSDSIQLEKALGTPYFDQLRGKFIQFWSDLLQNMKRSENKSFAN